MEIQAVEFYPIKTMNNKLMGTLHVYLCDYAMDLRGIYFILVKGKWIIRLPYQRAIDVDSGAEVLYPNINFTKKEIQDDLMNSIRKVGVQYIEENFIKTGILKITEDKQYPKPHIKRSGAKCYNRIPQSGNPGDRTK